MAVKETRILMGMPVSVEIVDAAATDKDSGEIFSYFQYIDDKFSVYKDGSEISKINRGELKESGWSEDMKTVFRLSEKTKQQTDGYFDITKKGGYRDPSGLVKGWAIWNAAKLLIKAGFKNFYVEAGGDIQVRGINKEGHPWKIGIRNPFNVKEIIKTVLLRNEGIATSGTYERGQHIYNPYKESEPITDIVSLTVVGPNVYEADRFATAAFAMGKTGILFIGKQKGLEGYVVDSNGIATMTAGFGKYTND